MVHMPEQIKSKKSKLSPTSASEGSSNSIHMALQEWCAVPRDDLDNEYLIINYIVSIMAAAVTWTATLEHQSSFPQ